MIRILVLLAALVLFIIGGLILVGAIGDNTDVFTALGLMSFGLGGLTIAKLPLPE